MTPLDQWGRWMTPLTTAVLGPHFELWSQKVTPRFERTMSMSNNAPLTISVPEAGRRYFGLSRNGSYVAAGRGDIPTIKIGRLLRVPVRALEQMLDRASAKSAEVA